MVQAAAKAGPTLCNHGSLNEGFHLLRRQACGTPEDACTGTYSSGGVCKPQRGRGPVSHVPEPEHLGVPEVSGMQQCNGRRWELCWPAALRMQCPG